MGKANYADLAPHSVIHKEFIDKLSALSVPLSDDSVSFAKKWYVLSSCGNLLSQTNIREF